jgi:hypothetical protein
MDGDMKRRLTAPALFGKVISPSLCLCFHCWKCRTRCETRSHSSWSRESSDIVFPMIWKVSHDKYGGTQLHDRSVPDRLDRLDLSEGTSVTSAKQHPTIWEATTSVRHTRLCASILVIAVVDFFRLRNAWADVHVIAVNLRVII